MSEQETTTEAPPAEGWSGSHEFTVNVNFAMAAEHGAPCYVVKHNGRYLRIPSAGRLIFVPDKRFATRIDSRLWAMTLAGQLQGGKIVRLVTKEEREWRETAKSGGKVWTYKKTKPGAPVAAETPDSPQPIATQLESKDEGNRT